MDHKTETGPKRPPRQDKKGPKGKAAAGKGAPGKSGTGAAASGQRIAKVLARAGYASRREIERLIGLGQVAVNGRILDTPAVLVKPEDTITVEGRPIGAAEPTRVWRYHKPVGLLTTHADPKGRPTVFSSLPPSLPRVISVGRLDLNSEGLLLLTNDGELARELELPSNGWVRHYRARALGRTTQAELDRLKDGVTVDGIQYGGMEARLDKAVDKNDGRANLWISVSLAEGKNREVRKVLESIGLKVNRLIRLAYGPFALNDLPVGEVEEVGPRVVRELLADKIKPENLPPESETRTRDAGAPRSDDRSTGRRGGGDRFKTRGDGKSEGRGDRPARPFRPRPSGEAASGGGDRAPERKRDFAAGSERPPRTSFGDKPFRPRREGDSDDRPRKPRADGPRFEGPRFEGSREDRFRAARPEGDRPHGDRPRKPWPRKEGERAERGDRPFAPRSGGDRFGSDRPRSDRPRSDRPEGDRPRSDRPRGERPQGDRPYGDRPRGERSFGERSFGNRPTGDRASGDRGRFEGNRSDRPQGERPRGERPQGDRPRDERPRDERPRGDRPRHEGAQGEGRRFGGPRPEGARFEGGRKDGPRGNAQPRFSRSAETGTGERPDRGPRPSNSGYKPGGKPGFKSGFKPGGKPGPRGPNKGGGGGRPRG